MILKQKEDKFAAGFNYKLLISIGMITRPYENDRFSYVVSKGNPRLKPIKWGTQILFTVLAIVIALISIQIYGA